MTGSTSWGSVASGRRTHVDILVDRLHAIEPEPFWTCRESREREYEVRFGEV